MLGAVTFTDTVHVPPAAMVPLANEMDIALAAGAKVGARETVGQGDVAGDHADPAGAGVEDLVVHQQRLELREGVDAMR